MGGGEWESESGRGRVGAGDLDGEIWTSVRDQTPPVPLANRFEFFMGKSWCTPHAFGNLFQSSADGAVRLAWAARTPLPRPHQNQFALSCNQVHPCGPPPPQGTSARPVDAAFKRS